MEYLKLCPLQIIIITICNLKTINLKKYGSQVLAQRKHNNTINLQMHKFDQIKIIKKIKIKIQVKIDNKTKKIVLLLVHLSKKKTVFSDR